MLLQTFASPDQFPQQFDDPQLLTFLGTTDEDWQLAIAEGRDPIFYDKELVRIWGKSVVGGIHNLEPTNPNDMIIVHSLTVPDEIIARTTERYLDIFSRLTGQTLENYQGFAMGID